MRARALQVDIYEIVKGEPVLVVTHVFYGRDDAHVMRIHKAHMETDTFYRAAIKVGRFRSIPLRVHTQTYEVIV